MLLVVLTPVFAPFRRSFQRNKSLAGFVKYALRVKYGFGGTRDGFDFIREVDFIVL